MADLYSNDTFTVPAATHRTYSDDGLSWPNRKADFIGTLVPFMVCPSPAFRTWWNITLMEFIFRFYRGPPWLFASTLDYGSCGPQAGTTYLLDSLWYILRRLPDKHHL